MQDPKQTVKRRGVLAGVGAVGALTTAAVLLPSEPQLATEQPQTDRSPTDTATGYRLTEHVKRYYQTTRV